MIKWISIVLTSLCLVIGAIFFLEDRYENEADAIGIKFDVTNLKQVSQEQIDTLKSMQRYNDTVTLESLQNQKFLLETELNNQSIMKSMSNNTLLRDKIQRLENIIKKLEDRLFQ